MKKHFYTDIIEIDSVYTAIDLLTIADHEKHELISIVESHVHHTVLDVVLSELHEDEKRIFLAYVSTDKHKHVWHILEKHMKEPAKKIRKAVDKIKQEFHEDIKKTKKK